MSQQAEPVTHVDAANHGSDNHDAGSPSIGTSDSGQAAHSSPQRILTELTDMLLAYARQQALRQVSLLNRWLWLGIAGALAMAVGAVFLVVAALRVLQTETGAVFEGNLSVLPYVIVLVAALVTAVILIRVMAGRSSGRSES